MDMPFSHIYISQKSEQCSAPQLKHTIHNCINNTTFFFSHCKTGINTSWDSSQYGD